MDTSVSDLLTDDGFRAGVACGAVAGLAVAVVLRAVGDQTRVPLVGGAFAAAVLAGFAQRSILEAGLLPGMVVLAASIVVTADQGPLIRAAAALPGAVIVAVSTGLGIASWATPVIVGVVLVGGLLLSDFERSYAPTGVPPLLLAVSVAGVWATIPETEHVAVLAGVAVPMALVGWLRPRASLGVGGATLVIALFGWTVVTDGTFRPGSVVGGLACLGVLVLEPVVRRGQPPLRGRPLWALVLLQVVVVALSSRVAGLRTSAVAAFAIVAGTYALAAVVTWGLRRKCHTP